MKIFYTYFLIIVSLIAFSFGLNAQVTDTLEAVKLFSKKQADIATSAVPLQKLNKEALSKLNSVSVADAVKYFSGVVVKDYGGIGGLKTVSVRSLGANHTGVMYDGIIMGDAQGGQIDLGRLSLENIEQIQLYNNHHTDILLPARTYASAAVLALSSFGNNRKETELTLGLKAGSFGFINPSLSYKSRSDKKFSHSISGEYQSSNGAYYFIDYETGSEKRKRNNSDLKTYRLEYDAAYFFNDSSQVKLKTYYYHSKRGLPGAVILYNDFSDERLNNRSFFSQFSWQKNISLKSTVSVRGKYSADYKYYLDPSYQNNFGRLQNEFHQQEIYASAVYSYKFLPSFSVSYAADYFRNKLIRTDPFSEEFANPERNNILNNIAFLWKWKRFGINGNLLHTYITQKVERGPTAKNLNAFAPAIAVSLQPVVSVPWRIRASYKRIFRAPTFDDLYFTNIGNTSLRPEYAHQYNLGMTFSLQPKRFFKEVIFTADVYYNKVTDQILAVPRQNLFQWTMLNIGKVEAKGSDLALHLNYLKWRSVSFSLRLAYTFQNSLNVSDSTSALYKTQLPYTPRRSGSVNLNVSYRNFSLAYNILASSYRYRLGEPNPGNFLPGWSTHDISFNYAIHPKTRMGYKFIAELNNIYNLQYDIIKYYPMPRFNYRLGIIAVLKTKP